MKTKYIWNQSHLSLDNVTQNVLLKGWVAHKRNLGHKIFLVLRDISGTIQLVLDNKHPQYNDVMSLKLETVIEVKGKVIERISKNNKLPNGDIEILIEILTVLSEAHNLPLNVFEATKALEEQRLKYRYLDLRKTKQKKYLIQRHAITQNIRQTLLLNHFFELETPLLCKYTPEGARDYLVPSRIHPHHFYALPQSPQIFKQLYMLSGFERYFQIAKCFRDEDLRADRQPEFTQIDIETSFLSQEEIIALTEEMMYNLFRDILNKKLLLPLNRITFKEALNLYGTDKPDLRFGLNLEDWTSYFQFPLPPYQTNRPQVKGIKITAFQLQKKISHKKIKFYQELLKNKYNLILHIFRKENDFIKGYLSNVLQDHSFLNNGDLGFFIVIEPHLLNNKTYYLKALGFLRLCLGQDLDLIDHQQESLVWIIDFPLLEFNDLEKRYYAMHHPFTAPQDISILQTNPSQAISQAYDLVWNGYEIGGGSLRNYQSKVQTLIFNYLGFSEIEIQKKFGFFIEALKYGAPPHGGIALGLDRLVMLCTKTTNIKDVIAFPKTQSAQDLMIQTPSNVEPEQLAILKLQLTPYPDKKND